MIFVNVMMDGAGRYAFLSFVIVLFLNNIAYDTQIIDTSIVQSDRSVSIFHTPNIYK